MRSYYGDGEITVEVTNGTDGGASASTALPNPYPISARVQEVLEAWEGRPYIDSGGGSGR